MDFFSGLWTWFKGNSISSSLAKTALLGYASRLLGNSTNPSSTGDNSIVDKGVRLQLDPNTENKIPVLYGEAYFGGYITDAQLSTDYKKMTYVLTLAELTGYLASTDGPSSYSFEGIYINNNRVVFKSDGYTVDYTLDSSGNQDISASNLIKIYCYCDQTGVQPMGYSGSTPSPFDVMPGWSAGTHSMEDLMYIIVEVTYNRDAGISGLPNITVHAKNTMTLVGDVLFDYMTNTVYGASIPNTEIDGTSILALNSYCTTGFSYTALGLGTTTSEITVNGLVDTNTDVLTNMTALAEAGSSWLTYDIHTGLWKVVINKSGTSVASFTDSNIIGEISISGTSLTQLNNIADVKYQNTDIQDKTDFVKVSIPEDDLFANEPRNAIQINLPFTNKQVVAAKIGLQALKQARVDKIITFKADYSYTSISAGDIIDVTSEVYGFTNKLFRVITVTQTEGNDGELGFDFTALEYDSAVYDYDITEYAVESDNGILGIGSIGQPNTPTVTKTEQANVPKIVINTVVPSGIVDTMEFWITFDTGVENDAARSYVKIGQYTDPSGATLTEDAEVSYTYSGLQQSDFYIKVRGVNNVTTGPFSSPSGLIEYVPIVVADTISDNPVSIGGQLMSLGLLTLLNNLDKLFSGDQSIWDIFTQAGQESGTSVPAAVAISDEGTQLTTSVSGLNFTGAGVTATASGSVITVDIAGPNIAIKDEGTNLSTSPTSINFTGDGVTATASGNAITVNIPAASGGGGSTVESIDDLTDVDTTTTTPTIGDYLQWDGTNWIPSGTGTGEIGGGTGGTGTGSCTFTADTVYLLPPDEATTSESYPENSKFTVLGNYTSSDTAPISGNYFVAWYGADKGVAFTKGTSGNIKLYKSDGTLVQSLTYNDVIIKGCVVGFPFSTRQKGVDYYITVDAGVVKDQLGCGNPAISPGQWNFNTPWDNQNPYDVDELLSPVPAGCGSLNYQNFYIRSYFSGTDAEIKLLANRQTDIRIQFNYTVELTGEGTVTVYVNGSEQQVIDGATANSTTGGEPYGLLWTSGSYLYIDPTIDFSPGDEVAVLISTNVVRTSCGNKNGQITTSTFTVDPGPTSSAASLPDSGVINEQPLALTFDRPVVAGTGNLVVYDGSGNVVGTVASDDPAITYTQGVA